jgi:TIR domain
VAIIAFAPGGFEQVSAIWRWGASMSGIINYFHGESGRVADVWWELAGAIPDFALELAGDPHRVIARDYGSDIGIDPQITHGDEVIYLRLEDTTGIWVRSTHQSAADLHDAIARVMENRSRMGRWRSATSPTVHVDIARDIYETFGTPLRVTSTRAGKAAQSVLSEGWAFLALTHGDGEPDRPRQAASFFLSHAAEDTLLARRIVEDLKADAGADIWFDLAQPAQDVPKDDAAIADWLRRSILAANGFVMMWTEHAARSAWVRQEFAWAHELGRSRPGFQLILLKLRDVPIPAELTDISTTIDCNDIWWSNGLNEELYAAVFKRQPRRAWLDLLPRGAPVSKGTTIGYDDFVSHAGTVEAFDWSHEDRSRPESLRWRLTIRHKDGTRHGHEGGGADRAADLAMKPGDRAGFYKVRWRHGSHFREGPELWMRSADLGLTSDTVLDHYYDVLRAPPGPPPPPEGVSAK